MFKFMVMRAKTVKSLLHFMPVIIEITSLWLIISMPLQYAEANTMTIIPFFQSGYEDSGSEGQKSNSQNLKMPESYGSGPEFKPWGGQSNDLTIGEINNGTEPIFHISGRTGDTSAGFKAQDFNADIKRVTISVGGVNMSPEDPIIRSTQATFSFLFTEPNGSNSTIKFILGPSTLTGWHDGQYYQRIAPNSSDFINVKGQGQLGSLMLKSIDLVVQKRTLIDSFEFDIKFQ
jgi:hypothetical protein